MYCVRVSAVEGRMASYLGTLLAQTAVEEGPVQLTGVALHVEARFVLAVDEAESLPLQAHHATSKLRCRFPQFTTLLLASHSALCEQVCANILAAGMHFDWTRSSQKCTIHIPYTKASRRGHDNRAGCVRVTRNVCMVIPTATLRHIATNEYRPCHQCERRSHHGKDRSYSY